MVPSPMVPPPIVPSPVVPPPAVPPTCGPRHSPAAAQVDDVVDHAAGEMLLGHAWQGGHQVPHGVAGRGQDVLRVAGVAGVTGEESGQIYCNEAITS